METVVLLFTLVPVVFFLAVLRRCIISHGCPPPPLRLPRAIKVRDPAVARRMLVDHADAFSNRPLSPFPVDFDAGRPVSHSLNTVPHGPLWRALRRNLTADVLHPSRLGLLAPLQREAVDALVADLAARGGSGVVVVRNSLRAAVFALVARLCFGDGVDARDVRAMQAAIHEFFLGFGEANALAASRLSRLLHWRRWLRFAGTFDRLIGMFHPHFEARRRQLSLRSKEDSGGGIRSYVDTLIELQVPDDDNDDDDTRSCKAADARRALRSDEIAALVWEFLGAGTETVVSCVEWALAHLVAQPDIQKKLHRELVGGHSESLISQQSQSQEYLRGLPYLRGVILETLRLHPPVAIMDREVDAEAAAFFGATTPGSDTPVRFTILPAEIGRDRKSWAFPDEFRPERFLAGGEGEGVGLLPGPTEIRMMPFGGGRRHCPGAGLGMMHVRCFLAAMVREFEWAPAAEDSVIDLTELDAFFKVMKTPLRACLTPRM